jgi:hypothetical protein
VPNFVFIAAKAESYNCKYSEQNGKAHGVASLGTRGGLYAFQQESD